MSPRSASSNKSPHGTAPKTSATRAPKAHQKAPLLFLYKLSAPATAATIEKRSQTTPSMTLSSIKAKTPAAMTATNPAKPSG